MKKKCASKWCRNEAAPNRRWCHKCKSRREKISNPIGYHFNILRTNARRRGKEFTLTKVEFEQFCKETNYINLKGKKSTSMTIDRIDPNKGYSYDNIQILSQAENGAKGVFETREVPF
jgi:hypothetical protein